MNSPAKIRANRRYYQRHRKAALLQEKCRRLGYKVTMQEARLATSRGVLA